MSAWVFLLLGGMDSIVFGPIRWCVWSFRLSSPLRLPHLTFLFVYDANCSLPSLVGCMLGYPPWLVVRNSLFLDPSYGVFGRFDLAALCGCHTLNVCCCCLFVGHALVSFTWALLNVLDRVLVLHSCQLCTVRRCRLRLLYVDTYMIPRIVWWHGVLVVSGM